MRACLRPIAPPRANPAIPNASQRRRRAGLGPRDEVELSTSATAAYFFASVPMGILGSLLGVRLSLRISDTAIFFFIGSVLIIIGIVLVVQSNLQS